MTNKQHPALFDWATELSDAEGHVTLSAKEAHEIGARLRSMGEKLKAYEDLDEAASDVQLLRMGYAAARLEIESLQARIKTMAEEHADELMLAHLDGRMRAAHPAGAQQPGAAYAALPDECDSQEICAISKTCAGQFGTKRICASHGQAPAQPAGEYPLLPEPVGKVEVSTTPENSGLRRHKASPAYTSDQRRAYVDRAIRAEQPAGAQQPGAAYAALPVTPQFPSHPEPMVMDWSALEISVIAQYGRDMYEAGKRASHGQASAQAAPAYKDNTPELHIGNSAFESWYSAYNPAHKGDKQRARDAYVAGMGDPLVTAAPQPAPQQEPDEIRSYAAARAWIASAAHAPADSVLEGAAQVEIDLFNDLNRIYGNTLTAYAKEMCRLGYRKTNAARKQGETNEH